MVIPSIPEDELRTKIEDALFGKSMDGVEELMTVIRQYAAKAELEGRQHESVYVRQYLNFDVNDPANKRYLTQRWYDLEERIKQLKKGQV